MSNFRQKMLFGPVGMQLGRVCFVPQQIRESDFTADLLKMVWGKTSVIGHKQINGNILIVETGVTDIQELRMPKVAQSEGAFFVIQNRADTGSKATLRITDNSGNAGICTMTDGQATLVWCDGVAWYSLGTITADGYGESQTFA